MKDKILEWNPGEKMSKEFALDYIDGIKQFYRRLFYQPQKKPFNGVIDFEGQITALNGLKELIEASVAE